MLFNIDADEGSRIVLWLVPDNPGVTPSVVVLIPDREEIRISATVLRTDVVELGFHHASGMIGFIIDESIVPNLPEVQEIEILEGEGRIPIYRRYQISRHLEKKLCYFDLSVMPQRRLMQRLSGHFALTYNYAQRYPLETMMMIVNNMHAQSVLITGRPNFIRNYGLLRNAGYIITALLRDPYEELAERLIFINLLATSKAAHLLPQFVSDIPTLVDFARDISFADLKALTMKFRTATPEQREAMTSPMTRVFGCGIDERPEHRHVSTALDNLGTADVVGVRNRFGDFRTVLTNVLGADVIGQDELEMFDKVRDARELLAQIGVVSDLLENDLNLYSYASEAVKTGLDGL
ncbi:MAG: hypothetical protein JO004_06320 [Methylobacteriaceae bacterium]|nr:hypothetical protein [Methylobacteriaceae bacterium]